MEIPGFQSCTGKILPVFVFKKNFVSYYSINVFLLRGTDLKYLYQLGKYGLLMLQIPADLKIEVER